MQAGNVNQPLLHLTPQPSGLLKLEQRYRGITAVERIHALAAAARLHIPTAPLSPRGLGSAGTAAAPGSALPADGRMQMPPAVAGLSRPLSSSQASSPVGQQMPTLPRMRRLRG